MTDNLTRIDPKRLEEILQIAPFHRWLGLTLRSCSNEQLELEMPWRDEIVSNPAIGSAHGGVLASLIDLTGALHLIVARYRGQGDRRSEGRLPPPGNLGTTRSIGQNNQDR